MTPNRGLRVRRGRPAAGGFTLLELVVVVAVVGILAAAATPSVVQQMMESRIASTRDEAEALYTAMLGRGDGSTQFGFVGDIGRLPQSFQELAQPGQLPSYSTNTVRNVGMGWRGPYVNIGTSASDYLTDAFGRPYAGAASGQVRSAGPDGAPNTGDDIVYPPSPPMITGDVAVTLKTTPGNSNVTVDPSGYGVVLYFAANGGQDSVADNDGPFTFANVPPGLHALRVVKTSNPKAGTIVAEDTIVVRPGSTTAVELWF